MIYSRCERSQKENASQKKNCGESITHMNLCLHLKMLEDLTKNLSNKQREASLIKQLSNCGRDSKKLYALMTSLMGTIQSNPLPECDSFDTLAWNFTDFFHIMVKEIRSRIISQSTHHSIRISQFG